MSEHDLPSGCAPVDEELSAWLDGELAGAREAAVAGHVADCARCRERADALRAVDRELRAWAAAAPPAAERLARLRARVDAQRRAELAGAAPTPAHPADPTPARPAAAARTPARAAPPRRRRWLVALPGALAAGLLAVVVLPRIFGSVEPSVELAAEQRAPGMPVPTGTPSRAADAGAPAVAPPLQAEASPPAAEAGERKRLASAERTQAPTPGHLGSAADAGARDDPASPADGTAKAEAPAAAAASRIASAEARRDAKLLAGGPLGASAAPAEAPIDATVDELDLALALDELADVAPADLALVEHLDALERMAGGGSR